MRGWLRDLGSSMRALGRRPGFTAAAILTLTVGIGASTGLYSAVHGVLLEPLPYPEASRLVQLGTTWGASPPGWSSPPDFLDWKDRLTTIEAVEAAEPTSLVITAGGEPERLRAARVSPGFLSLLGAAPQRGRAFLPSDHSTGAPPVVLLSDGLWRRRWGADPGVIGRTLDRGDGSAPLTVIGVLPSDFTPPAALGLESVEAWLALPVDGAARAGDRSQRTLQVLGRLAPGITLATAREEVATLAAAMVEEHPEINRWRDVSLGIGITSLLTATAGRTSDELLLLLTASGFLLLIGCANVARLLLARVTERATELAVRRALGAGPGTILSTVLSEGLCLGALGAAGGIALALAATKVFPSVAPEGFPRLAEVVVGLPAVAFACLLALLTVLLTGLAPALVAARGDLAEILAGGGTVGHAAGGKRSRLRDTLVVAETAIAFLLLAGAGLLVNSYLRLQRVDPGFDPERLLLAPVEVGSAYDSDGQRSAFFHQLRSRVASLPGVGAVSFVADPPIGGNLWAPSIWTETAAEGDAPLATSHLVGPDYLRTAGMHLLRGRGFGPEDDVDHPQVAVVNETMARQIWPDRPALGRRFRLGKAPDEPWITVVGVVRDVHQEGIGAEPTRELYLPYAQHAWWGRMYLVVRTGAGPDAMAGAIREALRRLDPAVPFDGVSSMEDRISSSLRGERFRLLLLVFFAAVAMLLSTGGTYGAMLHAVCSRAREVGIRMALGAGPGAVLRLVVGRGMALTALGIGAGLAAAVALSRLVAGFVFGVAPTDPATLAGVSLTVMAAAFLACYLPARQATRVDPLSALRGE